jgi:hypothetical protein
MLEILFFDTKNVTRLIGTTSLSDCYGGFVAYFIV